MTKLVFITSGKIDYTLPGKDLYDSIYLTASGKQFPSLTDDAKSEIVHKSQELRDLGPSIIYTATSAQCAETAQILSDQIGVSVIQSNELLPLRFNLNDILSKDNFESKKISRFEILRNGFIEMFFKNELVDSNKEIENRYNDFILGDIVKNNSDKTAIVVSHAYLIKLLYIYNEIKSRIYTDKETLIEMFNPNKETMQRLETLTLEF